MGSSGGAGKAQVGLRGRWLHVGVRGVGRLPAPPRCCEVLHRAEPGDGEEGEEGRRLGGVTAASLCH